MGESDLGMGIVLAVDAGVKVGIDTTLDRTVLMRDVVRALGGTVEDDKPWQYTSIAGEHWSITGHALVQVPLGMVRVPITVLVTDVPPKAGDGSKLRLAHSTADRPVDRGELGWDFLVAAHAIIDADRWRIEIGELPAQRSVPGETRVEVPLSVGTNGPLLTAHCGTRTWQLHLASQADSIAVSAKALDPSWILGPSTHCDGDESPTGWWPLVTAPPLEVGGVTDPTPYVFQGRGLRFCPPDADGWVAVEWLRRHHARIDCAHQKLSLRVLAESVQSTPASVVIPFEYSPVGCPAVHVSVDGIPLLLLIDSGSNLSFFNPAAAAHVPTAWFLSGSTGSDLGAFGTLERAIRPELLAIGGMTMRWPILYAQSNKLGADGVIGFDLLTRWRAVIDFSKGTLTINDPFGSPTPPRMDGTFGWEVQGLGLILMPGYCGKYSTSWIVDTGCARTIVDVERVPGRATRDFQLTVDISLGGRPIVRPVVIWDMDLSALAPFYSTGILHGIIGCDILAQSYGSIDYGTRRIQLGILEAVGRGNYALDSSP